MRVAMLHWAFPPMIGGVETHLAMLAPGLVRRGVEVDVLTCPAAGCPEKEDFQGVRVHRTPLMNLNELPPQRLEEEAPAIREKITAFIAETKPDLIHAHNFHYFSPVHAEVLGEIKSRTGLPLVMTAHNIWNDELGVQMHAMSGQWDGVIAVSKFIKQELVKAGYSADRIKVVYHGIDHRRFAPGPGRGKFAGRRVIFHPARMCYDKGTHVAVGALSIIKRQFPEVLLVMAGTDHMVDWRHLRESYVPGIMRRIEEGKLQGNVHIEFFPWEKMPEIYREAEICIYPSCFEEPFGLALLEANACGKPIVVSRAGGMPEIIEDGVNGFIVDMHDHHMLARRCAQLLADPGLGARMGRAGRALVLERFGEDAMVEATLEFYRAVAGV